jgi:non-canonical poly(A) RNA polymerase PAPD5/7
LVSETGKPPVKFSHLDNLHPNRIKTAASPLPLEPAPVISIDDDSDEDSSSAASAGPNRRSTQVTNVSVWPPPTIDHALPGRVAQLKKKRKREDEYDGDQSIVPEWRAKPTQNPCPWYREETADTLDMGHRLHKEICDYYDYVRPRVFENDVRADLVRRMQAFLDTRYKDRTVKAFGSYEAGLCLPDSDMDLVVLSKGYMQGGTGIKPSHKVLQRFGNDLKTARMHKASRPLVVVAHAKVPIIKFIDDKTGLRVDVAFENDTGVTANQTYRDWHAEFPLMAPLVSLVKQWLYMRGQNDNATGGLGGFSTTCTVVSLLQQVRTYPSHQFPHSNDLGELFMYYLKYYGEFDTERDAIQLNPPIIFEKSRTRYYNPQNPSRLCIVDPNRPDNDISGGSRNAHIILENMYDAFEALRDRIHAVEDSKDSAFRRQSLLAPLFAGDYSSFENTREHLRNVAKTMR